MGLYGDCMGIIWGLYGGYIGYMLGLYRDNGKESGNCYLGTAKSLSL